MTTLIYGIGPITDAFVNSKFSDGDNLFASTNGLEKYKDKEIHSLSELKQIDISRIDRVVICSMFISQIYPELIKIGFDKDLICFFDYQADKINKCGTVLIDPIVKEDILYAFYDLSVNYPTYDAITFAIQAEVERVVKKCKYIQFVIVPDRSCDASYFGTRSFYSQSDFKSRIDRIVKGVFSCVPKSIGVIELAYREQADIYIKIDRSYPDKYMLKDKCAPTSTFDFASLRMDYELSVMKAPDSAIDLVNQFLRDYIGKKIITITLREYDSTKGRNSNIQEWAKFLSTLNLKVYQPVIIRDTYKCTKKFGNILDEFESFPLASLDFSIRVALYMKAYVNLSVSNGPTFVQNFIKNCSSITFMHLDDNSPAISTKSFSKSGVVINENLPYRDNSNQLAIWKVDSYEEISKYFDCLVDRIEQD